MNKRLKYSGTDKMSDLICENYNLLLVMSRFGLSLGFGDQTVQQVCERQGVHTGTFLAVVNFMDGECCVSEEFHDQISVEALMEYLKQAHSYFLDYNLPVIRRRLIDAIDCSQDDVAFLILKYICLRVPDTHSKNLFAGLVEWIVWKRTLMRLKKRDLLLNFVQWK